MKTLIINCSYNMGGSTANLIIPKEIERFKEYGHEISSVFLPNFYACYNCKERYCFNGFENCHLKDSNRLWKFYVEMKNYDNFVFVTPVYLNAPTPKTLSFLSRLNTYNDIKGRNMFEGKKAYITAIADVSGTQQTISIMISALNLLGFEFPSKGNREHIWEWKTGKIRGGNLKEKTYYIENRPKGGNE